MTFIGMLVLDQEAGEQAEIPAGFAKPHDTEKVNVFTKLCKKSGYGLLQ
jgi:hypothetical protein